MNVKVLATKNCSHCFNFCNELDNLGIDHQVYYCDDEPELVKKYNIRHSPNLVVDETVVFRKQPTELELKQFFNL
ncbi:hypothetical protein MNBD_GAMMA05-1385 [hydrothermal vent metagenome]|uniref:Thioredoxin-like fold domain-containing protein n=1 Tax=hydrothermal vent metagenome TaxID=652676 RepID=A0A3B0X380_9ZZZZ